MVPFNGFTGYRQKMTARLKQTLGITAANGLSALRGHVGISIRIVLVGDSTVTDAKGWGRGLKKLLKPGVICINRARKGRSSRSFINEGWWNRALAEKPDYVLIQFGHNDVPGKGSKHETDPATTYPQFLSRYVDETRVAGAKPVLITPMTRRHFTAEGTIMSDLVPYAEAVKKLAEEKGVPLIDLHAESVGVLNRLGPQESEDFDFSSGPAPGQHPVTADKSHLSPKGADVMGRLVAENLGKVVPELRPYIE
jgi:lysophospholipase L1-like esterase